VTTSTEPTNAGVAIAPGGEASHYREPTGLETGWASISAIFAKETRWRMRGRRAFVIVTIYVAVLALLVLGVYRVTYDRALFEIEMNGSVAPVDVVSGSLALVIGQSVFTTILITQTLLTVMLAPGLTSGSISSEREKQTLELLITTPVSTLGMVIGKLMSSLAYLFLLVLASIPLMSVVFIFGGIAPEDVIKAYVLLLAVTFGIGSIGMFMSALLKRTQVATALSYVIVLLLAVGSLVLHTYWYASSRPVVFMGQETRSRSAPEALVWLSPFVADIDLLCTAMPDSYGVTCSYIATVTGQDTDFTGLAAHPPRDTFWPRSVAAFLGLGVILTLLTTQLIAPSRRLRRGTAPDRAPPPPAEEETAQ